MDGAETEATETPPAATEAQPDTATSEGVAPADGGQEQAQEPQQDPLERRFLKAQQTNRRLHEQTVKANKRLKELESRLSQFEDLDKRLTEDPWSVLAKKGWSEDKFYRKVLEANAAGDNATPEQQEAKALAEKVARLEQEREEERRQAQEGQLKQAEQQAMQSLQADLEAREDLAYTAGGGLARALFDRIRNDQRYQELAGLTEQIGTEPLRERVNEIARGLEAEARKAVHTQVGALLKKSPEFRAHLKQALAELEADGAGQPSQDSTDQSTDAVDKGRGNRARPKTITRSQQSAVQSRAPARRRSLDDGREALKAKLREMGFGS